ncbi:MAG: hypothetical protein HY540_01720 [Deltaproteobacteria bacterium]|nr:hypothetical protein [Deltaproteobacteria bacterium]
MSLRDALIKAGVVTQKDLEKEKVRKQHVKTSEKIKKDQLRIMCDACGKTAPDVEQYQHRVGLIAGKEWLCLMCADEYQIDDQLRQTAQSSHARSGMFQRRYGRTKRNR